MKVAIIMGSNSDWPILEPAEKTLKEFGVEVEVIVASAHRTPDVVHEFAAGARNRGVEAIIAAAGAAGDLLSAHANGQSQQHGGAQGQTQELFHVLSPPQSRSSPSGFRWTRFLRWPRTWR